MAVVLKVHSVYTLGVTRESWCPGRCSLRLDRSERDSTGSGGASILGSTERPG